MTIIDVQRLSTRSGALARAGVTVADLRIEQRTLDDAFTALTGGDPER